MRRAGSPTLAIGRRINPYEHRCRIAVRGSGRQTGVDPVQCAGALACSRVHEGGATPPWKEVAKMDRKLRDRAARRVQQADSIAVSFELRGFDGLVTVDRL